MKLLKESALCKDLTLNISSGMANAINHLFEYSYKSKYGDIEISDRCIEAISNASEAVKFAYNLVKEEILDPV